MHQYDDQGRMVRSIVQSEWTAEDRALMLGRQAYQRTLCPNCGHPKDKAWHPDNEGWFEVTDVMECHACTALRSHGHDHAGEPVPPVEFLTVTDTRDYETKPLPPIARAAGDEAMGGAV